MVQIKVETQRGFVPVDERMRVIDADGNLVCWISHQLSCFHIYFVIPEWVLLFTRCLTCTA